MTTGYVLVLAVLILGGVIATLGDRIGMKVGKARLSLFRLRPRQTATVVSILTGSVISASTLALLFGVSRQLRTGVFELEQIQSDLAEARLALDDARDEKSTVEEDLVTARREQRQAQEDLQDINQFLRQAVERQRTTQEELQQSQTQLSALRDQLGDVSRQSVQLQSEIRRLENERADLLAQQSRVQAQIAQRDRTIAARDRDIAQREQRLSELQSQQAVLQEDIAALERQFEGLFRGSVAVGRNQPLVSSIVRVRDTVDARRAIDQLLREANREAIRQIAPGTERDRQVLLIDSEEVFRLVERISDQRPYVIRILSAANYIIGEPCVVAEGDPCVQVFIEAAVNEVIYEPNERLAKVTVDPRDLNNQGLVEKLNLLFEALQFRARQDGVVGDSLQVAQGRTDALLAFLDVIRDIDELVEIQAIASDPVFTVGPLQVELFAVVDGRIVARTDQLPLPSPSPTEESAPRLGED